MQGRQEFQPELFSQINLEQLIPANHLLRKIERATDLSFIRHFTAHLYCEHNGRPSIDPELFFRMTLIMHLYNIPSDRRICEELQFNLAYKWFCKLSVEDRIPDHSSMTKIRDRMGEETFKAIFEKLIRDCIEKRILTADKIMMDGSLFRADAAIRSLVKKDAEGNPSSEEPPKYVVGNRYSNETHVSYSDPDSTLAGKLSEPKKMSYKLHSTIDRDTSLIIDAHITTGADVEGKVCMSRIDHIENAFDVKVNEMTADRGYGYGVNLAELEKRDIESFVPNFHSDVGETYDPELFAYDKENDVFTCQAGHKLEPSNTPSNLAQYMQTYRLRGGHCTSCPLREACFPVAHKEPRGKRITRNVYWEIQAKTKERESDPEFRRMRGERQWKMERIFAEAKVHHGLARARYRSRAKVQIQAYMIAFVQNLKRLAILSRARYSFSMLFLFIFEISDQPFQAFQYSRIFPKSTRLAV